MFSLLEKEITGMQILPYQFEFVLNDLSHLYLALYCVDPPNLMQYVTIISTKKLDKQIVVAFAFLLSDSLIIFWYSPHRLHE